MDTNPSGCFLSAFIMMLISMCGLSQMGSMNSFSEMSEPIFSLPYGCIDSTIDPQLDAIFTAPINTVNNTDVYASLDGTCTGEVVFQVTTIQAASYDEAAFLCESFGLILSETSYLDEGYPLSSDVWYCQ